VTSRTSRAGPPEEHASPNPRVQHTTDSSLLDRVRYLFVSAGPGLITGASDDDPSGIATYAQAGAQFGYGVLWLTIFSYPLMCAIQEVSARVGRISGSGITAAMKKVFPRWMVALILAMVFGAAIFNLGADLSAMADVLHNLTGGPHWFHLIWIAAFSALLQIFVRYRKYVKYLKVLSIALVAYVVTAFFAHIDWNATAHSMLVPTFQSFDHNYLMLAIAVLGTTITPYLFFWQSSQEAEDVRVNIRDKALISAPEQANAQFHRIRADTYVGMAASNLVAFFIMLTAAATLHAHGITQIQTAMQAAQALEPLAGRFAYLLFAAGIVGTGLLALPVMAGSAAFALAELEHWPAGLELKPTRAAAFNATIAIAMITGVLLNFVHLNPIRALVIAAVINGVAAAPVMAITMLLARNSAVVGKFRISGYPLVAGWISTGVMAAASIAYLAGLFL
jgi:NRAMP (natural resistance-associated macrophage protein)-like metal ion transporter